MILQPYPPQSGDEEMAICFTAEEIAFALPDENEVEKWLKKVVEQEDCQLRLLNFIFCSDEYLHQLNVQYLHHDTLTDVITFPYSTPPEIEGDIFISIDRVRENAQVFGVSFQQELHRVMAHGVLHLCGYKDKSEKEENLMRKKEDEALALWRFEK
jgi:rRNA maturation RNase YbeY